VCRFSCGIAGAALQSPGGNFIPARRRTDTMVTNTRLPDEPAANDNKQTGSPIFKDAAVKHADTTLEVFPAPDDSVFHAFRFDLKHGTRPTKQPMRTSGSLSGNGLRMAGFVLNYGHTLRT